MGKPSPSTIFPADGRSERFPALAADCLRLKADIIVVTTTPAAQAAKNATRTIPIVMYPLGDSVGSFSVAAGRDPCCRGVMRPCVPRSKLLTRPVSVTFPHDDVTPFCGGAGREDGEPANAAGVDVLSSPVAGFGVEARLVSVGFAWLPTPATTGDHRDHDERDDGKEEEERWIHHAPPQLTQDAL
jgi:hypothetical protein